MKKLLLAGACLCLAIAPLHPSFADDGKVTARPDSHAPIGVMRDHVHGENEWMLSYRYEFMQMRGNRDGDSSVSTGDVLDDFMVAPTEMPMHMHMIGAMYGLTNDVTLSVMTGFMEKKMKHIRRNGTKFTQETQGITDTKVSALYEFYNDGNHRFQFNGGLNLPTGTISDRKADNTIFGYAMQMGSGTYDLLPGVSYSGLSDDWSWGAQANTTLRIGRNNRGYTLGNNYQMTTWGARKVNDTLSVSLRLDGTAWENIDGRDRDLPGPNFMAPPLDPGRQAGKRLDALVGFNFIVPSGALKGNRFAAEFGAPVYQSLDGPRIETDYKLTVGWQYAF